MFFLTAPDDYISLTNTITLSRGSEEACSNITLQDDSAQEDEENFEVILTSNDERVEISRERSEIRITDEDGMEIELS